LQAVVPQDTAQVKPETAETPASRQPQPVASERVLEPPAESLPQKQPVREITIRISGNAGERVEVHMSERAGAVRVHVRTADADLSAALRNNLGELVRSITERGLRIETWTPAETRPSSVPLAVSERIHSVSEPAHAGDRNSSGGGHDTASQRNAATTFSNGSTTDEHRRGRAQQQWFDEFERRLGRS
jgi:hypothetical protein